MENYKEKYEHTLDNFNKIKAANKDNNELVNFIEYEYPELKESEDEKIRKEIVAFLTYYHTGQGNRVVYNNDWISWLEKQGKNEEINEASYRVGIKRVLDNPESYGLEKQGEQKPTDKAEPKFKVGDIITNKKSKDTVKIVQILHDSYRYSGWDGVATVHSDFSISEQDNWELVEHKHNWSEEDERKITGISIVLQSWDSYHVSSAGLPSFIPEYISWLKSLKKRYTWKPSDEQMKALSAFLEHGCAAPDRKASIAEEVLETLIEDLKKLREE